MKRNHYRNVRRHSSFRTEGMLGFSLTIIAISMVAIGGISYLSYRSRCSALGREITTLENELAKLNKDRTVEEAKWAECRRPDQIQDALTRHGLDMAIPRGEQIVDLQRTNQRTAGRGGDTTVASNRKR